MNEQERKLFEDMFWIIETQINYELMSQKNKDVRDEAWKLIKQERKVKA